MERYGRRVTARKIVTGFVLTWIGLMIYLVIVTSKSNAAVYLRAHVLGDGTVGVLLMLVFFVGLGVAFYSFSCPVCVVTFLDVERSRTGPSDRYKIEGYCPKCKRKYNDSDFAAEGA